MGWFIKFWEWLWLRCIKNGWSKLWWCRKTKVPSEPVYEINDTTMMGVARELYYSFDWKMDGVGDGFDTYAPAQWAYNRMYLYNEGKAEERYVDDCDGYHAGILHLLQENGYDTALITLATIPITQSHTMTAFRKKLGDDTYDYYVINYTQCLGPYNNLQDFVDNYGTPVRYWCLQKYNLEKGKYYNIDKEWGGVEK